MRQQITNRAATTALCLLFTLCSSQALAWNPLEWRPFADPEGVNLTINAPYTELHTGPGRGYPVTHVIERGEQLRVIKRKTNWYLVEARHDKSGWVFADDLTGSLITEEVEADFSRADKDDFDSRRWELGFALSDFSGARGLTTGLQYHFTPNISAELKHTQAYGETSTIKLTALNLLHQPFPEWRFSPFFTLGTGLMQTAPESGLVETEDRKDDVLTVGGGLFIYASRNFMLRVEYDNHTVLTSRAENEEVHEWKAGFSVFF